MINIGEVLFKSLIKKKWLYIEYDSKSADKITKFWISIKSINFDRKSLKVDSYNVTKDEDVMELTLMYDKIIKAEILEGTITDDKQYLIDYILSYNGDTPFISNTSLNNDILDYYEKCFVLDCVPYHKSFHTEKGIDIDVLKDTGVILSKSELNRIANKLNLDATKEDDDNLYEELAISVLSVNVNDSLYVLAYKRLFLDIKKRELTLDNEITINKEVYLDGLAAGTKYSINRFIGEGDLQLLNDFEKNKLEIMNLIDSNHKSKCTDMPHLCLINRKITLNLSREYEGIKNMYFEKKVTEPIKAFFKEIKRSLKRTDYPIALVGDANLDQLLAIHSSMKHDVTYVQGPPGTGKTNTIVNLLVTTLFNNQTALVCSYNNKPIDGIYEKLNKIKYNNKFIPFPCLRLGNKEYMIKALDYIKQLYEYHKHHDIFDSSIRRMFENKKNDAKALAKLLTEYEDEIDLVERKEISDVMLNDPKLNDKFKNMIKRKVRDSYYEVDLSKFSDEKAKELISNDDAFVKNLYFHCVSLIQKLNKPRFEELWDIVNMSNVDIDKKVMQFNSYLSSDENMKLLLEVFPIIITTNISSSKLGTPKVHFDMTVMDEAGQCNPAVSLVPILRGQSLVLVGDPQQLKPVILLDNDINTKLRTIARIPSDYDYIKNSIYKTFINSDCFSNEILLKNHYRCHEDIINFNNKKFYNKKLVIKSKKDDSDALVLIDMKNNVPDKRNTSINEAEEIIKIVKELDETENTIGVITPFVNQANLIREYLIKHNFNNVECGTIHTFQGDEKDSIIFSSALTSETSQRTYDWLSSNKELINVATSRAKRKLITLCSKDELNRLSKSIEEDDFKELIEYTETNGKSKVSEIKTHSRALGLKSFSSATESEFMETLAQALSVVERKCIMKKEVSIKSVFQKLNVDNSLFYTGVFDFVIFEKYGSKEYPVLAIELDGKEHETDEIVKERDRKKEEISKNHNLTIKRVKNEYSRRYHNIKEILEEYFKEEKQVVIQESLDI
ncbi:MAG: AAA domain-containing protein [bacterium]